MLQKVLLAVILQLLVMNGLSEQVRRRGGRATKGTPQATRGLKALAPSVENRRLKGPHAYIYEEMEEHYYKKKGKGKSKKGKSSSKYGYAYVEPALPSCRTVVEPAEFLMQNAFVDITPDAMEEGNTTSSENATSTEDASDASDMEGGGLGTQYVFQGPLFDDDFDPLNDYFVSGICTRTWDATEVLPGAAMCSLTITLETGACFNIVGEVFDNWENVLSITGGTFELTGASGHIVLVAVDDRLDEEEGDFFGSEYIRGQATLIYEICEEGYWDPLIVDHPDDLEGGTFPDPFGLEEH